MNFPVYYFDNEGNDGTITYASEDDAEYSIEQELSVVKEEYSKLYGDYTVGTFGRVNTEIWVPGEKYYACWKRVWKE